MKVAYKKVNTFRLFGLKILENWTEYIEHTREEDKPFDKIFIEKTYKHIESDN